MQFWQKNLENIFCSYGITYTYRWSGIPFVRTMNEIFMKFSHQLHIFTEDHITYFMSFKTKINKSDAIWNNISIYPMFKLVFHIASKNSIQKISFHKLVRSVHTRMSIHYYFGNDIQKLSSEFRNIRLHLNIFFFLRFCPKLFHHYKVLFSYTLLKHLCEVVSHAII